MLAPNMYPKVLEKGARNDLKIVPKPILGSTSAADLQRGNYHLLSSSFLGSPRVVPGPLQDPIFIEK